ncbi:hypothetical protein FS837_009314 [Tulasnella sp. UAMH 9824]|nr:hypothetical protein FS837_009314 [Tulasnella sp. UAMH 9824]
MAPLHPPEGNCISFHIRIVGDFTSALAKALGCGFDSEKGKKSDDEKGGKCETVLLVGAGISVTLFASILKSIRYRMNNMNIPRSIRLSKVYFVWIIRDFGST